MRATGRGVAESAIAPRMLTELTEAAEVNRGV
jgi:hypothetical protein